MMRLTPEEQAWMDRQQAKLAVTLKLQPTTPAKPKKDKPAYRPATEDELLAIAALPYLSFPVGHWDKRFSRKLHGCTQITDKQAAQMWRIIHRYRRQLPPSSKTRLLSLAEQHMNPAAPTSTETPQ